MKRWWIFFRLTNRVPGLRWLEATYFRRLTGRVRRERAAALGVSEAVLVGIDAAHQHDLEVAMQQWQSR